jgi:hypothetical protein
MLFLQVAFLSFLGKYFLKIDDTVLIILFMSPFFINTFKLTPYSFVLFKLTGMKPASHFFMANLSMAIWINLFYVAGHLFFTKVIPLYSSILSDDLLKVNIFSFIGFAAGNKTGVSDLLTVKNTVMRSLAMTALFSGCIALSYGLFIPVSYFYRSLLTDCIIFSITLLIWIFSVTKYKYIPQYD